MLSENKSLKSITLNANGITTNGIDQFRILISKNNSLENLKLKSNKFPNSKIHEILDDIAKRRMDRESDEK